MAQKDLCGIQNKSNSRTLTLGGRITMRQNREESTSITWRREKEKERNQKSEERRNKKLRKKKKKGILMLVTCVLKSELILFNEKG